MGHRVPPAISRDICINIYICIYFFFLAFTQRGRNEKKKENATSREKYMIYHVDYSKRNLFETKQRTRSHEFIRVFFFFFFDVTTGEHSTWQMFSLHVKHIRI